MPVGNSPLFFATKLPSSLLSYRRELFLAFIREASLYSDGGGCQNSRLPKTLKLNDSRGFSPNQDISTTPSKAKGRCKGGGGEGVCRSWKMSRARGCEKPLLDSKSGLQSRTHNPRDLPQGTYNFLGSRSSGFESNSFSFLNLFEFLLYSSWEFSFRQNSPSS